MEVVIEAAWVSNFKVINNSRQSILVNNNKQLILVVIVMAVKDLCATAVVSSFHCNH